MVGFKSKNITKKDILYNNILLLSRNKLFYTKFDLIDTFQNRNEYREGSVHAFVDKKTGQVYKPASWQAPAKHVRFDLRIIREREFLFNSNNTGWAGGYLYLR